MNYLEMGDIEKQEELKKLQSQFDAIKKKGLKLNMARGNPSTEQLELTDPMLNILDKDSNFIINDMGIDARNYGVLEGIPEARKLFGEILGVPMEQVIMGGNASLNLMFDALSRAYTHGLPGGDKPWGKLDKVKFLCPVPGYDRHFNICKSFGMEMIPIEIGENGVDVKKVKELAESDDTIKGIWCVPMYANPSGAVYPDHVVTALASMQPKAKDFRIMWDNAYAIHHLTDTPQTLLNIYDEAKKYGNEDMVYMFASTSKITYAGSGISAIAASPENIKHILSIMTYQTIGHDKVNQLRHVLFLKDLEHTKKHMLKHRAILKPKFDLVQQKFGENFADNPILKWTQPGGGYFVCADTHPNMAKKVVAMCQEAGVTLTPAGAPYPLGNDPNDTTIRIAPSYPPINELSEALDVFCLCVKLAYLSR